MLSHTQTHTCTLSCTAVSSQAPQSGGTPDFEHSEETGAAGQAAGRVSLRQEKKIQGCKQLRPHLVHTGHACTRCSPAAAVTCAQMFHHKEQKGGRKKAIGSKKGNDVQGGGVEGAYTHTHALTHATLHMLRNCFSR